jgi:mannose/fructose/N-acetylgalactosamine-specific phosphotransferase system component IIC
MNRSNRHSNELGWYVFAGCTLIGLGIGIVAGEAAAGLLIGAGIGFLAMVGNNFLTS